MGTGWERSRKGDKGEIERGCVCVCVCETVVGKCVTRKRKGRIWSTQDEKTTIRNVILFLFVYVCVPLVVYNATQHLRLCLLV